MTVRFSRIAVACALLPGAGTAACGFAQDAVPPSPERRSVAFLAAEVPKWKQENGCYSCHNNGDAARALAVAAREGLLADRAPLRDTLDFLAAPEKWDANGPEGPFKDKELARIQFAAALAEAARTGLVAKREAIQSAARLVAEVQSAGGAWEIDTAGVGSPATYGPALASLLAMRALAADAENHAQPLERVRHWFRSRELNGVLDAAATLWALAEDTSDAGRAQCERALEVIRRGQSADGGWGPFVNSPPEVFDTAVVVRALAAQKDQNEIARRIAAGRQYLVAKQAPDGSWPATTRPPGADSYAQRLSTSAWATMALLATRRKEP
jgi:hypothetical protein